MPKEVAVVGQDLFTLGFKLAGVRKTITASDPQRLNEAVRQVVEDPDIGILVMETDDIHKLEPAMRRRLEEGIQPTVVGIGVHEDTGLRDKLKQAIGVDVWK